METNNEAVRGPDWRDAMGEGERRRREEGGDDERGTAWTHNKTKQIYISRSI